MKKLVTLAAKVLILIPVRNIIGTILVTIFPVFKPRTTAAFDYKYFFQRWYTWIQYALVEYHRITMVGSAAPNPLVVPLHSSIPVPLLEFCKDGRPLTLFFGSCTCQFFMDFMEKFNQLIRHHAETSDFVVVYTKEAHPTDGWAMNTEGVDISVRSHQNIQERKKAAEILLKVKRPNCPVLVDSMESGALTDYCSGPCRLYVVLQGRIVYHGHQGPFGCRINEVDAWLRNWKKES